MPITLDQLHRNMDQLPDLGVIQIHITPCAKVGWQATLSSDGDAPNSTVGQGTSPSGALQVAIERFLILHGHAGLTEDQVTMYRLGLMAEARRQ